MNTRSKIEEIVPTGDEGFFKAVLAVDGHGAAIEVIGASVDECVTRAAFIRDSFNATKGTPT